MLLFPTTGTIFFKVLGPMIDKIGKCDPYFIDMFKEFWKSVIIFSSVIMVEQKPLSILESHQPGVDDYFSYL